MFAVAFSFCLSRFSSSSSVICQGLAWQVKHVRRTDPVLQSLISVLGAFRDVGVDLSN